MRRCAGSSTMSRGGTGHHRRRSAFGARTGGTDVTTFQQDLRHQPHLEPVAKPKPANLIDEYRANTCPLCFGPLQKRVHGLWCARDRGWLVEEFRGGEIVYRLWQGRP
jgi:hypothetical protein